MNPETNNQSNESFTTTQAPKPPHPVNQVTSVSKYLALSLFIILPFVGAYVGYQFKINDSSSAVSSVMQPKVINPDTQSLEQDLDHSQSKSDFEVSLMKAELPSGTKWSIATSSFEGKIFTFTYPTEIPIDHPRLLQNEPHALSWDPGQVNYDLPVIQNDTYALVQLTTDLRYMFYIVETESEWILSRVNLKNKTIAGISNYKKSDAVKILVTSDGFGAAIMPTTILNTNIMVANILDIQNNKLMGQIQNLDTNKKINLSCDLQFMYSLPHTADYKQFAFVCADKGLFVTDMTTSKLIIKGTATMIPSSGYIRIENSRIKFGNIAEANDMLRVPVYSVDLNGADLRKEAEDFYGGY